MKRSELFAACAVAAALLSCLGEAKADPGCILGNVNKDKILHVVGIAGIVTVGTGLTGDEDLGLGAGIAASLAREAYKWKHPGYHCSALSIGADVIGLAAGHYAVKAFHIGVGRDEAGKPRITARLDIPLGMQGN